MDNTHPQPQSPASPQDAQDYDQPVAYDNQGRPLYARPQQAGAPGQPQMVYLARPMEPAAPDMPEAIKKKAAESKKLYPHLNLSEGEYVITAVKRHPIGIIQIWAALLLIAFLLIAIFAGGVINPESSPLSGLIGTGEDAQAAAGVIVGGVTVLLALGGLIATYIYNGNRFYLTNESVIQEIQNSLFSKHEQTVSLSNVEDASYRQTNILQHLLGYGSIRLSTEGDETTYRFSYVTNPKKHIATLNNAVEAFKNGRPVHPDQPS
jgi:hypothetical protein